jgi:hypothetical protein
MPFDQANDAENPAGDAGISVAGAFGGGGRQGGAPCHGVARTAQKAEDYYPTKTPDRIPDRLECEVVFLFAQMKLRCMNSQLALSGQSKVAEQNRFRGVKWTSCGTFETSANDPKRTLPTPPGRLKPRNKQLFKQNRHCKHLPFRGGPQFCNLSAKFA